MWEKRILHPGLKTFRVIRGIDRATVELRAELQMDAWNARWKKIEDAAAKKAKEEEKARVFVGMKELAFKRTREAEQQIAP